MTTENVDMIFFGAHADDVEIGCGGTIVTMVGRGSKVGIVDLTRAEMGTRGTPEQRREESLESAAILGASFRETLDFGDGNLRHGREEEIEIIRILRSRRPAVIYAPWPDDRHPDHGRTGQLVTDAWFYSGLAKIDTGQAPHRPQVVIYYPQNYIQHPTFVVDVTAAFPKKMEALAAFRSQFYNPASNEPETWISQRSFIDMIEARARHFGTLAGAKLGEAFVTKQPPRIDDVIAAYRGRELS
ncbi:MAG: bacillithiol biosynthesis deacetylase BshB1 [Thermoanaerobaculia bacterium]